MNIFWWVGAGGVGIHGGLGDPLVNMPAFIEVVFNNTSNLLDILAILRTFMLYLHYLACDETITCKQRLLVKVHTLFFREYALRDRYRSHLIMNVWPVLFIPLVVRLKVCLKWVLNCYYIEYMYI